MVLSKFYFQYLSSVSTRIQIYNIPQETPHAKKYGGSVMEPNTENSASTATPLYVGKIAEEEYLSGFKLISVLSAVTLIAFLMLLDSSVIVTVGHILG
jgi:hypothetical protein